MSDNKSALKRCEGMIGLAARARKLSIGTPLVCNSVRRGDAVLVLISSDPSENTRKKVSNCCSYYNVKLVELPIDSGELGRISGKKGSVTSVSVNDANMAKGIIGIIETETISASDCKAGSNPQEV